MIKRILVTVFVVALAVILFALFISSTTSNPAEPVAEGSTANLLESEQTYEETFQETTIETLGSLPAGTIQYANDCGSQDCFQEKFAGCEPARVEIEYAALGGAYEYAIIGPATGGCRVTSQFIKHLSDEWVGKTMTCTYDNSLPIDEASEALFLAGFPENGCTGPLATLFDEYGV